MILRRSIFLCVLPGVLILAGCKLPGQSSFRQAEETAKPIIVKQPVNFSTRTFDPASPPADMPPLPSGETAECDTDFQSNASVSGQSVQTDATHATLTITQVKVTLDLIVTVWVPMDASQHVIEHEDGHRQISEYYYQTAGKTAERIAASYIGKQVIISGADLHAESSKALQQMGAEITDEYIKELNPEPAQLLYDSITDHSRNEVVAKEAVDHAIKNVAIEAN
ncbi:MAG: hypothetical protein LAO08_07200 [Acidobacteriia bacterium]|nr:hypothetical protein [Terriglobia bacterium]